jgi:uncharacterized tellurite resistance protein B-like protein
MFLASLTDNQKKALLNLAHNVAVSDGKVTTTERLIMQDMREEMRLSPDLDPHYLDLVGIEAVFSTRRSRIISLVCLIRLSYADGTYDIEEECFIRDLSRSFGVSDTELNLLGNWVRRLLSLEREIQGFM